MASVPALMAVEPEKELAADRTIRPEPALTKEADPPRTLLVRTDETVRSAVAASFVSPTVKVVELDALVPRLM